MMIERSLKGDNLNSLIISSTITKGGGGGRGGGGRGRSIWFVPKNGTARERERWGEEGSLRRKRFGR